ncbi:MAG: HD-GYP domain-containing protein [Pseudomonadota bacterium]
MKVKIDVQKLKLGMYVCELDRPWRETPFLFQGFQILLEEELKELQRCCRTVYINVPDVAVAVPGLSPRVTEIPKPSAQIVPPKQTAVLLDQALLKINNHPAARAAYEDQTTLEEEIHLVNETYVGARVLMQDIMWEAKFGRSLNVAGAKKVVGKMVESTLRNPDALICFAQLKRKDEYTAMHSLRVAILSLVFGRQLGLTPDELRALGVGALLHDVGKMKVPSEILNKADVLTPDELGLMKMHVPWGVEILQAAGQVPAEAVEIARRHHERYDGSGYMDGIKGGAIGMLGMITAIIDHYDAVTSDRAYRAGISAHAAMRKMYEWRGSLFESTLVEKFIQCMGIYPIGSVVELNSGEIGVVAALNRNQRLKPRVVLVQRADKTPYPQTPLISLANRRAPDGRLYEVERVVEPTACGIDPSRYLPIPQIAA